ncbi:hypothetical protein DL546_003347 [Coniochaeta pulveracea]|uniref:Uncharacterized protein n=1 Tax=Coniochaeta pulveracea TaxID=177199 RepID=A0A420XY25_9PEZI|nr:hypothetical protein DL546_003347 [Coniochaeta pulveracea]
MATLDMLDMLDTLSTHPLIEAGVRLLPLFLLYITIYCFCLRPLSRTPPPVFTAPAWFRGGQNTSKIVSLYLQYGPVIRINPKTDHLLGSDEVDVYEEALRECKVSGRKRAESEVSMDDFGADERMKVIWRRGIMRSHTGS